MASPHTFTSAETDRIDFGGMLRDKRTPANAGRCRHANPRGADKGTEKAARGALLADMRVPT